MRSLFAAVLLFSTALPLSCVASSLPWPFPYPQVPWHHGIHQHTYDELVHFAKYSSAVYQFICPRPLGNNLVESFTNVLTKVHGFIVRDEKRREVAVAFRGSQQLEDMLIDANLVLVPLNTSGLPPGQAKEASIHAGFLVAYNSVGRVVVDAVREQLEEYNDYSVVVAGHSMGGALASIASLSLKANFPNITVRLFTYGQPRTGNSGFADLLEELVGLKNLYRGVHTFDGVPTIIPESLGYRHHSREFWQFEEPPNRSTVRQCVGQEDPDCSRSMPSTGINVAHDVYFGQLMTVDATLCL